ncbi:haloacid dehalogenase type II [Halosegnis sp.]|uniref:haloacid dehalogenase type II n=1 Tax=Halosegnis sp. TaxID=2864959 RepID=UPI0035D460AA
MPAFDPSRVEAVTFDSYGTLVDTAAAASVLEGTVANPDAVAREWRENALFMSVVAGPLDTYETYMELHRLGLADALRAAGRDPTDERLRELNAVYHELAPYDDVAGAFTRLDAADYAPSILSNGDPAMLTSLVETTGIETTVHEQVSADALETFKPARALYEYAADQLDVQPTHVAHVTAHWMDVQGAQNAGMQGVWLDRGDAPWTAYGGEPHLTVDSLATLCDRLFD